MEQPEYMDHMADEAMRLLASELEQRLKEPVAAAVSERMNSARLQQAIDQMQRAVERDMAPTTRELKVEIQGLREQVNALELLLRAQDETHAVQTTRLEAALALVLNEVSLVQRAEAVVLDTLRQFMAGPGGEQP